MKQEANFIEDDTSRLFTEYGELVLLLDAKPSILREVFRDCSNSQLRKIITAIEDQINDTHLEGNHELFKRHLLVWMMCIRQLDTEDGSFDLNFTKWEAEQFH